MIDNQFDYQVVTPAYCAQLIDQIDNENNWQLI